MKLKRLSEGLCPTLHLSVCFTVDMSAKTLEDASWTGRSCCLLTFGDGKAMMDHLQKTWLMDGKTVMSSASGFDRKVESGRQMVKSSPLAHPKGHFFSRSG